MPRAASRRACASCAPVVLALVSCAACGCRLVDRLRPAPNDVAAARRLCNEGLSAVDREDLVRAEALLERAVQSCPYDIDARRHYAEVLWKRGERTEAVRQIAAALETSPADAELCVEAGGMYLELGLFDDAERLAREAVRLAPRDAASWHLQGRLALSRGQAEAALADFHRALSLAPDDRAILRDVADAYVRTDRPQRALATLAVLEESFGPGQVPADVLVLQAGVQESLGHVDAAADSYRRALARGDAPPEAAARLAALEQSTTTRR